MKLFSGLEPGASRISALDLHIAYVRGRRARLVAMPFLLPSRPPRADGLWPLITDVEYVADDGYPEVFFCIENRPGKAYEAYPADEVVVIFVDQERADRAMVSADLAEAECG